MAGVSVRACSSTVAMAASPTPATVRPGFGPSAASRRRPLRARRSALSHRLLPSGPEGEVKRQDGPHPVLKMMLDLLEAAAAKPRLLGASGAEATVYGLRR